MARDLLNEIWLPVPGYEDRYAVSNMGRVRALIPYRSETGILAGDFDKQGYRRVLLSQHGQKKRFSVHRLVCQAFHGDPPEGTECRHLNGCKTDDTADNLAWGTRSENMKDRIRHGTHKWGANFRPPLGEKHHSCRWPDAVIVALKADAATGMGPRRLARKYGMDRGYVYRVLTGKIRAKSDAPIPTPEP